MFLSVNDRIFALNDYEIDEEHKFISEDIVELVKKNRNEDLSQKVLLAANIRGYLG